MRRDCYRVHSASVFVIIIAALFITSIIPMNCQAAGILDTNPKNGYVLRSIYNCIVTDQGGSSSCILKVDGDTIAYMNSRPGNQWNYSLDTRGWSDGNHLIAFFSTAGTGGDDLVTVSVVFDNSAPQIINPVVIYNSLQTAAKSNDTVVVTATVSDGITGVTYVKCDGTTIGDSVKNMSDDGAHQDGSAGDGVYGSAPMTVNVVDGYYSVVITAKDSAGNTAIRQVTVLVDNFAPAIISTNVVYPLGQTAAKPGDHIRVTAQVTDEQLIKSIPIDTVIVIDDSGSMDYRMTGDTETKLQRAKEAAINFVNSMTMPPDRSAVYYFHSPGSVDDIHQSQGFTTVKSDVLTAINNIPPPDAGTPIYNTVIECTDYAGTNGLSTHSIACIFLTDGQQQPASNPAPSIVAAGNAWTIKKVRSFMIGFGNTADVDEPYMVDVANAGGGTPVPPSGSTQYYFAPNAAKLNEIYLNISQTLKKRNETAPFGIHHVWVNATNIGGMASEPMYDDGLHGDGAAGDNLWGSELIMVTTSATAVKTARITVYDIAGNTDTSDAQVVLDNTAPSINTISVQYLTGNSASDGDMVKFTLSASDGAGSGILDVTFNLSSIGGSPVQSTFGSYETPYITVYTGNETDVFTVRATAIDGARNYATQSVDVRVDNSHLAVAMSSPISVPGSFQYISGTFVFRASASDPSAVGQAFVNVFGSTVPMSFNTQTGYFEYSVDTTTKADGTYSIAATFYDILGTKIDTTPIDFRIDNTPPALVVNYPQNGAFIEGQNVSLNISASDMFLDYVQYNIDGNGWRNSTDNLNTSQFPDGAHTITVRAIDEAGHITIISIPVVVDNNLPSCALNSPSSSAVIAGNYVFKVTAASNVGVSRAVLTVFGNSVELVKNPATGYYEHVIDTTTYADSSYDATVIVYDISFPVPHIMTVGPVAFKVDNSIPTLSFNNPINNGYLGMETNLTLNISASDAFLMNVEYNIDGNGWRNVSVPLNTTAMPDGPHILSVRAIDAADHVTEKSITFILDKYPPVCSVNAPTSNEFVSGKYQFQATATDYVGVDCVAFSLVNKTSNWTVLSGNMTVDTVSGGYIFSVDTTTFVDEIYELNLNAMDKSGKATSTTVQFFIDNNEPNIFIISPQNMGFVEGIVNFTGNITYSDRFLDKVTYLIDGINEVSIDTRWNTTAVPDGLHEITFSAIDGSGKATIRTIKVYVDNNAPTCEVTSPVFVPKDKAPLYETVNGLYTFKVQSSDAIGVKSVNLSVFGLVLQMNYNPSSGFYEYELDTTALPGAEDGENIAVAEALDISGKNTTSVAVHFNLDNIPPVVSMLLPTNGMRLTGETEIRLNVSGETFPWSAWYNLDGNGWLQLKTVAPYTTINDKSSKLSEGEHTIIVKVIDMAKHETQVSVDFVVQNDLPSLTINAPNSGQYLEGLYTIQVSAGDPVGITSVFGILEAKSGGSPSNVTFSFDQQTGYFEYLLDTMTIPDGDYLLTVHAKNTAWENVRSVSFKVDNHAPVLLLNKPQEGQYVSGIFSIIALANDTYLLSVEYNIDSNSWTKANGKGTYTIQWDTRLLIDGNHEVNVRATDRAGHETSQGINVNVDNTLVTVSVQSPADSEHINGIYEIKVMAEDSMGVQSVRFLVIKDGKTTMLSNRLIKNSATQFYGYNLNTSSLKDGKYQIKIMAFDFANHVTNSTANVTIDNSPPQVIILAPKSGSYHGSVEFKASAKDQYSSVRKVELYIDSSKVWVEMLSSSAGSYSYVWFTDLKDNGVHVYGVRATDSLGNTITVTSSVSIGNIEQKDYLGMILRVLPLMMFIFIILMLILVLILLKRGTLQKWVRGDKTMSVREPKENEKGTESAGTRIPYKKENEKESELISSVKKAKVSKEGEDGKGNAGTASQSKTEQKPELQSTAKPEEPKFDLKDQED